MKKFLSNLTCQTIDKLASIAYNKGVDSAIEILFHNKAKSVINSFSFHFDTGDGNSIACLWIDVSGNCCFSFHLDAGDGNASLAAVSNIPILGCFSFHLDIGDKKSCIKLIIK